MKLYQKILIASLVIYVFAYICFFRTDNTDNYELTSSEKQESSDYISKNERALIIGNYLLSELEHQNISPDERIYRTTISNDYMIKDEDINEIWIESDFQWADFYDENTVLIYGDAFSQVCYGYLITSGNDFNEGCLNSENLDAYNFDEGTFKISETSYDNLYSFNAGL